MAVNGPKSVDIRHSNSQNFELIIEFATCFFLYYSTTCMICISTFAELNRQNYGLALYCMSCNRWGEADLNWIIQTGKGDKAVTETSFRCRDCGKLVEKQVRPPVPVLGGAAGYI